MNLIAIDIGNTNISIGLFLKGREQFTKTLPGRAAKDLADLLKSAWQQIPAAQSSKEKKRDGVIVLCSVKPTWTEMVGKIAKNTLGEKIHIVGSDIPVPIELSLRKPQKVGTDRLLSAVAAYAAVEKAVVVADFGTAVTIDLVDDRGVFVGGVICPGFEISAKALKDSTAQLPQVEVTRPQLPFGRTTAEAINCGLYYSAIGTLETVVARYADKIGTWPQTVITGAGAEIIKQDCDFVDNYVPNLVVKGIALAYRKYLDEKQ